MFNVSSWANEMRAAIAERNAERLSRLMYENDRNGCFSYTDVCNEFGEMSRDEWISSTVECAQSMLDDLPNHTDVN